MKNKLLPALCFCVLLASCSDMPMNEQKAVCYLLEQGFRRGDEPDVDSLCYYTHLAFDEWATRTWSKKYRFEYFKKYILPYRVASEPLEYCWREDASVSYGKCLSPEITDVNRACQMVAESIFFSEDNSFWKEPLQSYSVSSSTLTGKCDDGCIYRAMVMRSLGIPVVMETIPYWGDHNNGHSFNALIMPDASSVGFNNTIDLKKRLNLQRKVTKIYRHMFEAQTWSMLYRMKDKEFIPSELSDFHLMDVTTEYDVALSELHVCSKNRLPSRLAYLSVFSPVGWKPVAWTALKNGRRAAFLDIGTGFLYGTSESETGEDVGDGIVYLPVYYDDIGNQIPMDFPYILKRDNVVECLKPDMSKSHSVVLKRKFPRKARIIEFAEAMKDGYFEGADNPDFSDAELLHYVLSCPDSHMQKVKVQTAGRKYRYVRYTKRKGGLSIGEMHVYGKEGGLLEGKAISDSVLEGDKSVDNISDGDCLTYFDSGNVPGLWVGLDFSESVQIDSIAFCPRTDDNDICPGDEYELFYWNDGWISLGRRTAAGYELTFDSVPYNALLWLRDLTRGREERPFIYENDRQIWY